MEIIEAISERSSVSATSLKSDIINEGNTGKERGEEFKIEVENLEPNRLETENKKNIMKLADLFAPDFDIHLLDVIGKGRISLIHKGVNLNTGNTIVVKYSRSLTLDRFSGAPPAELIGNVQTNG